MRGGRMSMLRRLAPGSMESTGRSISRTFGGCPPAVAANTLRLHRRRRGDESVCAEICRPSRPTASGRDISSMCPNGASRRGSGTAATRRRSESARSAHRIVLPNGECLLAQAAIAAGIPYVCPCEHRIDRSGCRAARTNVWFQLYPARDSKVTLDMVARPSKRGWSPRVTSTCGACQARAGQAQSIRLRRQDVAVAPARRPRPPRWASRYLAHGGMPAFGTWSRYARPRRRPARLPSMWPRSPMHPGLARPRRVPRAWPRKLVLKGIQHVEDAARAVSSGVDGVIVSNHGGRQLGRLPAAIEVLPEIREAVGGRLPSWSTAACGAARISQSRSAWCDFVFLGRAPIYGLAAGGLAGATRAIEILREELDLTMGQIGLNRAGDLRSDVSWSTVTRRRRRTSSRRQPAGARTGVHGSSAANVS